ncbi:hypothetical protein [Methyloceanibacter caenitepidi]|uniref:Uncharacterized protein n=1 Tax=Methyloceanibacter caenitepidi TaxID=1384459 RepID=A0A0A8JZ43_9HYPH|nr:hypothetical protein [Methyloceanibacter caenitepidi]BAQ15691.1 hypothetical protein GL4_0221 [Methyloceanibacter caenitepidi]
MATIRRMRSYFSLLPAMAAFVLLGALPAQAERRDGVNGCFIEEVETDAGKVWRHKLDVQVPKDGYCRLYIVDDKDKKSWRYCSLKRAAENPVSDVCDDPVDDPDFDYWKAKAVCGGMNLMATCRREKPLQPGQFSGD